MVRAVAGSSALRLSSVRLVSSRKAVSVFGVAIVSLV
jgi:hypothetical protein